MWIRRVLLLVVVLACRPEVKSPAVAEGQFLPRAVTVAGVVYRYQVYVPPGYTPTQQWPMVLVLHGGGEYGDDGEIQLRIGLAPAIRRHPERFPAIVVFPQAKADRTPGWQGAGGTAALAALDQAMVEFHGDSTRIALTGFSVGGNGAWSLARRVPKRFARLMVICGFVGDRQGTSSPVFYPSLAPGNPDPYRVVATHLSGIPIWIFHGGADPTVSVEESRRMHAAFRAIGAPVTYTELDGVLHNAWDVAYERPAVAEWLTGGRVSQK